jgi:hypothetical protein
LGATQLSAAHDVADPGPPAGTDAPLPSGNVARVAPGLITKKAYDHWFRAAVAQTGKPTPKKGTKAHTRLRNQTMQFLVSARWIELEAPEHSVSVSKSEVTKQFNKEKRKAFGSNESAYRAYLKRTKRTEKDLRWQVKLSLLTRKVEKHATAGLSTKSERQKALDRFVEAFQRKWRARSVCLTGYFVKAQCSKEVGAG